MRRRERARAVAGFVPDCAILFARLLRDPRVPRRHKALLGGVAGYLALPFDVIPDFIPVLGQLDDALVVVAVLRAIVASTGASVIEEHWPGPQASLAVVLRAADVEHGDSRGGLVRERAAVGGDGERRGIDDAGEQARRRVRGERQPVD